MVRQEPRSVILCSRPPSKHPHLFDESVSNKITIEITSKTVQKHPNRVESTPRPAFEPTVVLRSHCSQLVKTAVPCIRQLSRIVLLMK